MGARGRKSGDSLTVVPSIGRARPEPPSELTTEQAETWRGVVQTMPPEWFDRAPELLVAYVRHISAANVLAAHLDGFDPADLADDASLKRFDRLSRMAARQSAALASLATKMRLTQQSRWTAKTAGTAVGNSGTGRKPWDI